jgi:leader peptidase (prepilin peptidase)/N-methyltransferase
MVIAFTGLFGAVLGSFLNVVVYRLPRHESIVWGASHCPTCAAPIKPYDNVPILSWLLLRGHCRNCKAAISPRYPMVEAASAALCVGAVLAHPSPVGIALGAAFVLLLIPAALIDLQYRIIPNKITAAGVLFALVAGTALDPGGEPERLIAGAGAGGFLLLAALAYPGGMGIGDVKLAGMMGLFLGESVIPAILIALVCGVLVGALVMHRAGVHAARKTAIPFGPFLAAGGITALFVGAPLIHWYTTHFIH